MKILRAYKTRLSPNETQKRLFVRYAGAARFVYNWALADRAVPMPTNWNDFLLYHLSGGTWSIKFSLYDHKYHLVNPVNEVEADLSPETVDKLLEEGLIYIAEQEGLRATYRITSKGEELAPKEYHP